MEFNIEGYYTQVAKNDNVFLLITDAILTTELIGNFAKKFNCSLITVEPYRYDSIGMETLVKLTFKRNL